MKHSFSKLKLHRMASVCTSHLMMLPSTLALKANLHTHQHTYTCTYTHIHVHTHTQAPAHRSTLSIRQTTTSRRQRVALRLVSPVRTDDAYQQQPQSCHSLHLYGLLPPLPPFIPRGRWRLHAARAAGSKHGRVASGKVSGPLKKSQR